MVNKVERATPAPYMNPLLAGILLGMVLLIILSNLSSLMVIQSMLMDCIYNMLLMDNFM